MVFNKKIIQNYKYYKYKYFFQHSSLKSTESFFFFFKMRKFLYVKYLAPNRAFPLNRRNSFFFSNFKQLTVYDKLGGSKTIELIIDYLYEQILEDPELSGFFRGADIPSLKKNQQLFIQGLFGGPSLYTSQDLPSLHHGLGIQGKHFDMFKAHFVNVLRNLQIKEKIVIEAMDILEKEKKNIIKSDKPLGLLGGDQALQAILEKFYNKIVTDSILVRKTQSDSSIDDKEAFINLQVIRR